MGLRRLGCEFTCRIRTGASAILRIMAPCRSVKLRVLSCKFVLWPGLARPPTSSGVFRNNSWMAGPSPAKARICSHGDAAPTAG